MTLTQVIEALVFASPKPLLTKEILAALRAAGESDAGQEAKDFARTKEADLLAALAEIQTQLTATGRAFQLVDRVNGWTLVSDPACAIWVRQLYPEAKPTRLTGPQLETLAIIAYRQPVTRADIEAVRGVAVDGVMQVLLDRSLVKIAGRAELPGRPLLYSTTEYFLQHFGLKSTDDLPNASELKRVPLPTAAPAEPATAPGEPALDPEQPSAPPAGEPTERFPPASTASDPEASSAPEDPTPESPETTTEASAPEAPPAPSEPEEPSELAGDAE
jgi:segregation and condensation protein B